MADFPLRGISDELANGIKAFARDRGIALNQAVLELIQLGIDAHRTATTPFHDPQDIATLSGTWNGDEMQAFRAAVSAMEKIK
jgi:hypothetical protein